MNLDMADAQRVLACIGDPSRFRMVALLADGDHCVTDIAREVGLSQSCTTRHLQVLLRCAIVSRVRQGKRVLFRLRDDEPAMASLLEWALLRSRHDTVLAPGRDPGVGRPRLDTAGGDIHRDRPPGHAPVYRARQEAIRVQVARTVDTPVETMLDASLDSELETALQSAPARMTVPTPDLEDYLL